MPTMVKFRRDMDSVVGGVAYAREGSVHPVPDYLVAELARREVATVHTPEIREDVPSDGPEDSQDAPEGVSGEPVDADTGDDVNGAESADSEPEPEPEPVKRGPGRPRKNQGK